jgi:hypothetical protein
MKKRIALGLALALLAGACASLTVSDDAIVQRTGSALGLEPNQFKITNRMNEGTVSRYKVETNAGKKFNCSVGGSLSILGASATDAICTEAGAQGAANTCNALLKAANKC